jgi:hypothetical protein
VSFAAPAVYHNIYYAAKLWKIGECPKLSGGILEKENLNPC